MVLKAKNLLQIYKKISPGDNIHKFIFLRGDNNKIWSKRCIFVIWHVAC